MFKRILVPLDLQDMEGAKKTLQMVSEYTNNNVDIHLLSVLAGYHMPIVASYFPKDMISEALNAIHKELDTLASIYLAERIVSTSVTEGTVYKAIVKQAKKINADLVIIGSHKHNTVEKIMLGSVASKVTERAKCSVLVIRH